jgi:hypothetical protein
VLGDEDSLEIFPHFKVAFCGIEYDSFFINSNGHVTFGAPAPLFASSAHKVGFLMGEPGIAGLYADLDPTAGGTVSFDETANDVTVRFEDVPRAGQAGGANTFAIRLVPAPLATWTTTYGDVSASGGLAGFSCGRRVTSGFVLPSSLAPVVMGLGDAAVFERFDPSHDNLSHRAFLFLGPGGFHDTFEAGHIPAPHRRNDTFDTAAPIRLPFESARAFSAIDPVGGDVDYYRSTDTPATSSRSRRCRATS